MAKSNPSVCGDGTPVKIPFDKPEASPPVSARTDHNGTEFLGDRTIVDFWEENNEVLPLPAETSAEGQEEKTEAADQPAHTGKSALFTGAQIDFLRGHLDDDSLEDLPDQE